MENASKKFPRVNIEVDPELWRKVGLIAAADSTTKKAILDAALKDFFNKYRKDLFEI